MKEALRWAIPRSPLAVVLFMALAVVVAMLPQPSMPVLTAVGALSIGVLLDVLDDLENASK